MIICPDCGRQNLDESRFCNGCGRELVQEQTNLNVEFENKAVINSAGFDGAVQNKKNKWIIILPVAIGIIGLTVALFLIFTKGTIKKYTPEQQYAMQAINELTSELLRPDSFIPYDIYVEVTDTPTDYYSEREPDKDDKPVVRGVFARVYVHYSADNKGGGITESEACIYINDEGCEVCYPLTDQEISDLVDKQIKENPLTGFAAQNEWIIRSLLEASCKETNEALVPKDEAVSSWTQVLYEDIK